MSSYVTDKSPSYAEPVGVIRMKDEPDELVLIKFIGWLIVMILFLFVLMIFADYFGKNKCPRMDGFLLKQENSDYAHDGLYAGYDISNGYFMDLPSYPPNV